ncbi:hypothetical protein AGOR_G00229560 [Albula goreensis]|uniref:Uncharacterized protein n=1 Tax=Albula goreensis TaxID=1534307 RepID=A0A8T3CNF5_9TELE|nr:hypothetical protein AGOR_G00229560 [Albula goreensis]
MSGGRDLGDNHLEEYHLDPAAPQSTQQEVSLSSVKPVLPHLSNGQNDSIFAYGTTGAASTPCKLLRHHCPLPSSTGAQPVIRWHAWHPAHRASPAVCCKSSRSSCKK